MHDSPLFCGGLCQQSDAAKAGCGPDGEKCGLCPLAHFYKNGAHLLPAVLEIADTEVPAPYRQLLVHDRDMTTTLENFHKAKTHLRVLRSTVNGDTYEREVVLALDGSERPVEFGALTVHLDRLPATVRGQVAAGRRPFGGILVEQGVKFTSHPKAFIRIEPDAVISESLGLKTPAILYGRCNALFDDQGRVLADIVEVLPP
jgi:chorismate-pyruvate lyase